MNISGAVLTRFLYRFDWTDNVMKKGFDGLLWLARNCGNHEDVLNNGMIVHSDFDHRKYSGSAGRKEEVRYG